MAWIEGNMRDCNCEVKLLKLKANYNKMIINNPEDIIVIAR